MAPPVNNRFRLQEPNDTDRPQDGESLHAERQVLSKMAQASSGSASGLSDVAHGGAVLRRDDAPGGREADSARRAEARYRTLVEQIPAVTFMAALDQPLPELYVSPQIEQLLGFSAAEWLSDPIRWFHQIHPLDQPRMSEEFARACLTGGPFQGEFRVMARDQRIVWVRCETRMVRNGEGRPLFLHGVGFDLTELKKAEEEVRAALKEKEVLLKEVHHRVKNNLQITCSLIRLQASKLTDPAVLEPLIECEKRVRAMALVHEKLYQSKDFASINFGEYLRDLSTYLMHLYKVDATRVALKYDLAPARVGIDQAVPCALIVNELLSNCIRHGFPGSACGEIVVSLRFLPRPPGHQEALQLGVTDTGRGLAASFDPYQAHSLGMELITSLVKQLRGTLAMRPNNPGTRAEVTFSPQT